MSNLIMLSRTVAQLTADIDRFNVIADASNICIASIVEGTYATKKKSMTWTNSLDATAKENAFKSLFSASPKDYAIFFLSDFDPTNKYDLKAIPRYVENSKIAIYKVDSLNDTTLLLKHEFHSLSSFPISTDSLSIPLTAFGHHTFLSTDGMLTFDVHKLIAPSTPIRLTRPIPTPAPPSIASATPSVVRNDAHIFY